MLTKKQRATLEEMNKEQNLTNHFTNITIEQINTKIEEEEKNMNATEKIIAWFKENEEVFNDCIEELDSYNGYLGDDR